MTEPTAPHGPGAPFEVLLDGADAGQGLPEVFRAVYGGDWVLPDTTGAPYRYSNFVMSHDGRVSFNVPGHEGGGDVSGFDPHDQWLMGLLRARADAVTVGANTLRSEPDHLWTPGFIFPRDGDAFAELRAAEGRRPSPLQVFLTRSGDLPASAAVFAEDDLEVVVATTERGRVRLEERFGSALPAGVLVAGEQDLDIAALHQRLHAEHGVRTVLCEGGPRVYGALVAAGELDEEFLTLSPVLVGGSDDAAHRPGLIEGLALSPTPSTRTALRSVRRAGDHLFLRSAYDTDRAQAG
ncbi:MAG: dihydrofolate reductase family protein [Nitriliruptoraceae bacterium]|nr:dihydrofolate reductase family protein [Nitriliruptoraceae bacterium]